MTLPAHQTDSHTGNHTDSRTATRAAIAWSEGIPLDSANDVVFQAPWQAHVFAATLALHQKGLFTWAEWAQALSRQIRTAQACGDPDRGDTYYLHWLAALEQLCKDKQLVEPEALARYRHAWAHAAERTPHGQPIALRAHDFNH